MHFATDDRVEWDWGRGTASGRVAELHETRIQRTIKGTTVTRNGTPANPAVIIRMDDGGMVLKLASELRLA